MKQKIYRTPEMEITEFEAEDVITDSSTELPQEDFPDETT